MTIHDEEPDTDVAVVRRLITAQCPQWEGLPLNLIAGSGTDHAMWRLGPDLVLRLPRIRSAAASLEQEARFLPAVRTRLPVATPVLRHVGVPGAGYPWRWAVLEWLPGSDGWSARDTVHDPFGLGLAGDLATFVLALRQLTFDPGLLPRRQAGQRGGPMVPLLERLEGWLADYPDAQLPREQIRAIAAATRPFADDAVDHVPTHGDLIPGNIVLRDRRLTAVIDWGYLSLADPALDLVAAWAVLGPQARNMFRDTVRVDDATWARARLNALEQAIGGIVYYRPRRHPLADVMSRTLDQILADPGC